VADHRSSNLPTRLRPNSFPLIHLKLYLDRDSTDVATCFLIASHQPACPVYPKSPRVRRTLSPYSSASMLQLFPFLFTLPAPTLSGSAAEGNSLPVVLKNRRSFFSCTYELPILQAFCFDIHALDGGCRGYRSMSLLSDFDHFHSSLLFSSSCALFSATAVSQPFAYQPPPHSFHRHGGCTPSRVPSDGKQTDLAASGRVERGFTQRAN